MKIPVTLHSPRWAYLSARIIHRYVLTLGLLLSLGIIGCASSEVSPQAAQATVSQDSISQHNTALVASDERVLKLEGSSNFRDMGGYMTVDGKTVRRNMLFRSGAMTSLTAQDMAALNQMNFSAVVDLRSSDELELYPNRWVQASDDVNYINHEYSMLAMMGKSMPKGNMDEAAKEAISKDPALMMAKLYRHLPQQLQPQLRLYFNELLEADGAVVVNCSAGQDRTGFTSAMILSALGVPRETILKDYLLSTQYRRPKNEKGDVDLKQAAKTNAFAKMMLGYSKSGHSDKPNPLYTADGTPFLSFALEEIESRYGSVEAYLDQAVGVDAEDIATLRGRYLN